ncbi:hypothetical protein QJS66_02895 [Kocuria rhizophila]|nr:hypothetical protein QJS66_02895 [Kocuria rhizophila]
MTPRDERDRRRRLRLRRAQPATGTSSSSSPPGAAPPWKLIEGKELPGVVVLGA